MSSGRKSAQKVRTLEFRRLGLEIDVYFDAKALDFFAAVGHEVLRHPEAAKLEQLVKEAAKDLNGAEWHPVIEITSHGGGGDHRLTYVNDGFRSRASAASGGLKFEFERYWLAEKKRRQWVRAEWREPDNDDFEGEDNNARRFARAREFYWNEKSRGGRFFIGWTDIGKADEFDRKLYTRAYVAYTPELWDALTELIDRLKEAQNRLSDLIGSPAGRAQLVAGMLPLALPAAKEEPTEADDEVPL